jgi:hypothetical protein
MNTEPSAPNRSSGRSTGRTIGLIAAVAIVSSTVSAVVTAHVVRNDKAGTSSHASASTTTSRLHGTVITEPVTAETTPRTTTTAADTPAPISGTNGVTVSFADAHHGTIAPHSYSRTTDQAANGGMLFAATNAGVHKKVVLSMEGAAYHYLRARPGWNVEPISDDPTWTPAACGSSPFVLAGDRYNVQFRTNYDAGQTEQDQLRVFDMQDKQFRDYVPSASREGYYTGTLFAVNGHAVAFFVGPRGRPQPSNSSTPGNTADKPVVLRTLDLKTNTFVDREVQLPTGEQLAYVVDPTTRLVALSPITTSFNSNDYGTLEPSSKAADSPLIFHKAENQHSMNPPAATPSAADQKYEARMVNGEAIPTGGNSMNGQLVERSSGRVLLTLTKVTDFRLLGLDGDRVAITYMNTAPMRGITSTQVGFYDPATNDWNRVVDVTTPVADPSLPQTYRDYPGSAQLFVEGVV